MALQSSTVIIIVVIAIVFYLIYSQNTNNPRIIQQPMQQMSPQPSCPPCPPCRQQPIMQQPTVNKVIINRDDDPYSDQIKKQDAYHMYDPLSYPQLRLPRDVMQQYMRYYEENGVNPPFNIATQPHLFDNPIMNGYLVKIPEAIPIDDVPPAIPLFRVKNSKNANRYFYYIIDQRILSKIDIKIPLDDVSVNGVKYSNVENYGLPELFDNDIISDINIYPGRKFNVKLYKTYFFP